MSVVFGAGVWILYLLLYGVFPLSLSQAVYHLFVEVLAPAPVFWLIVLLTPFACVLPGFFFRQAYRCCHRSAKNPLHASHHHLMTFTYAEKDHTHHYAGGLGLQAFVPSRPQYHYGDPGAGEGRQSTAHQIHGRPENQQSSPEPRPETLPHRFCQLRCAHHPLLGPVSFAAANTPHQ